MRDEYSMSDNLTTDHQSLPTDLELLQARYLNHLQMLNYSPRTIAAMPSYFKLLARFMAEVKLHDVQALTSTHLLDFQRWLYYEPTWKDTARSVASQNRVLSVVRGFFKFLKQEGYTSHDPAAQMLLAREPDALPRNVLTPQEARKIIEAPDVQTSLGYRDRTILEVLYATGIRKNELMNLTLADVNLEEELLRINDGKGGRDRVVPLSGIACSFLESYIKAIRPELLQCKDSQSNTPRLFISLRGRPMARNTVGAVVEKYAKQARIKKHVTCHLWRHTCATHLLKNNANLRHVQEMLGHRSLATTERYLRLTITDLKEAHRKFHPREVTTREKSQSERRASSTRTKRNA